MAGLPKATDGIFRQPALPEEDPVKSSQVLVALFAAALIAPATAGDAYMTVQTWDIGCEHTMTTNHFDLVPGQSVEIHIDLSICAPDQLGGLLVYGYKTTRNSSRQLTRQDNVLFTVVDETSRSESSTPDGYLMLQLAQPTRLVIYAQNTSRTKPITVRLRSKSGL
jgi:hypothetical protein